MMNTRANNPLGPRPAAWAQFILAAAIVAVALYLLVHHLGDLSPREIIRAGQAIPTKLLWTCGALTGISFLALGGYDVIAVRVIAAQRISPQRAWLTGAIANAISNTLGFHALTGTAVRYRLLTRSGLTAPEVAGVTALSWTALALGFASMFSVALATSAQASPWQRIGGLFLLALLLLSARWLGVGKIIRLGKFSLRLPSGKLALAQMALGAVEMASAIGALYVLMPTGAFPSFPAFATLYIGAVLLGIASHAPGGLGVFEAAMLSLSAGYDRAGILAALLLYRLIYNIGPFVLAALAFAGEEMRAALNLRADISG
jgi:uncharacterized membrane protein YbhN (UPF0104 family)